MKSNKTRNLSLGDYFIVLQKEYLMADFRRKIFSSKNDKAYYQRVMDGKKSKILDIASRNRLDSIFDSDKILSRIKDELFNADNKPRFQMTEKDIENYYSDNSEFSFEGDIFRLLKFDKENDRISLENKENNVVINVDCESVIRIL